MRPIFRAQNSLVVRSLFDEHLQRMPCIKLHYRRAIPS